MAVLALVMPELSLPLLSSGDSGGGDGDDGSGGDGGSD